MQSSWLSYTLWLAQFVSLVRTRSDLLVPRAEPSAIAQAARVSPISVPPSQSWDGPDGPWSSFAIGVGTPAQYLRVLVSTASQGTWVVLPSGCVAGDTSCTNARGGIFNPNVSSTWSQRDFYKLPTEQNLAGSVTALFGNDTLRLGVKGDDGQSLAAQVIEAIADPEYYLGMLGVNPQPINFTALESGQSSYITSLKDQNMIPSVSFGYTAGAPYKLKKVLASLTLGGYDQSRFTPNQLSFSFAPPKNRDLVVGIQSITSTSENGTSSSLLPSGILAYVDSTIAEIWLPEEACQAFEKAFGLTYDETSKLYPVDDASHEALLAQNASISFTLGHTSAGGETINITLPYASFDLQATPPVVANSTKYFPIKRADNATQYTLGRIFLQEAYLIVDWERSNFSLSQCLFEENSSPKLTAIEAASATPNSNTSGHNSSSSHGKTAGIAVGVTIPIVIIAFIAGFLYFRRKKQLQDTAKSNDLAGGQAQKARQQRETDAELDAASAIHELGGGSGRPRREGRTDTSQSLPQFAAEKESYPRDRSEMVELTGDQTIPELSQSAPLLGPVHEMYGSPVAPVELPANEPGELPGSPVTRNVSSAGSSSFYRGFFQSRSSTPGFLPSPTSGAASPNQLMRGPSTSNQPTTTSPPGNDVLSPISPIAEAEHSTSPGKWGSLWRAISQPRHSSGRTRDDPQANPGNV